MDIARTILGIAMIAVTACQPEATPDVSVPGARPIAYNTIRNASGVLGYAESLLGPDLATNYHVAPGPGGAAVDPSIVAGAWELPSGTKPDAIAAALRDSGTLAHARDRNDGQIWIADYQPHGKSALRLLLIDGNNPAFEAHAVPGVRPGPHIYLVAYRRP